MFGVHGALARVAAFARQAQRKHKVAREAEAATEFLPVLQVACGGTGMILPVYAQAPKLTGMLQITDVFAKTLMLTTYRKLMPVVIMAPLKLIPDVGAGNAQTALMNGGKQAHNNSLFRCRTATPQMVAG